MKSKKKPAKVALQKTQAKRAKENQDNEQFSLNHIAIPANVYNYRAQKFLQVNDKFTEMLGISRQECLEQTSEQYGSWFHASDLALIVRHLRSILKEVIGDTGFEKGNRLYYSFNHRIRGKDGKYRNILSQNSVIEWDHENNFPAISINLLSDITSYSNDSKIIFMAKISNPQNQQVEKAITKEVLHSPLILSTREKEILTLMVSDQSSTQIAKALDVSPYTARSHWRNILSKTGCKTKIDLKEYARVEGWI